MHVYLLDVCSQVGVIVLIRFFFFFKQKTAYEMRISDWSSDVCSSDLADACRNRRRARGSVRQGPGRGQFWRSGSYRSPLRQNWGCLPPTGEVPGSAARRRTYGLPFAGSRPCCRSAMRHSRMGRSEEHTSELQSLMRISYAVFSLKKQT